MVVPKLRFKGFTGEWDKIKLSQIADIIKDKNDGAEHPVMMLSAVKGFINQQEKYSKDNAGSSLKKYTLLRRGDLAYNRGNSKLKKYGCIFELENSSALVPYVYHCFRMKNGNSTFYGNYLNSGKIDKELRGIISSSARMDGLLNVSEKDFVNILVSKPILSEQQKIADFLTTFDKRITAQQNIVADLEETKKGLLQKIFSQEIRFKDDNGQDYPDWKEKRLGDVCCHFRSGKSIVSHDIFSKGKYKVFGGNGLRGYSDRYTHDGEYVLIGRQGALCGNINYVDGKNYISEHAIAVQGNEKTSNIWLKYKLIYMNLNRYSESSAQPGLSVEKLIKLKIKIPCLAEQQKIADFMSTFDKKITAEKQVLSDLQEIKKGLLQQMFV